jgi:hypothetical protein
MQSTIIKKFSLLGAAYAYRAFKLLLFIVGGELFDSWMF